MTDWDLDPALLKSLQRAIDPLLPEGDAVDRIAQTLHRTAAEATPSSRAQREFKLGSGIRALIVATVTVALLTGVLVVGFGLRSRPNSPSTGSRGGPSSPSTPTPSLLPSHGRIAFHLQVGITGGYCNIFTIEPNGSGLRQVTNAGAPVCYQDPAWTPAGDRIVFDGGPDTSSHLFSVATSGGAVRQLTFGSGFDGDPAISGDGTRIAFDRGGGPHPPAPAIFVMNADGSNIVRLTTPPPSVAGGDVQPSFSPDGTKVAFVRGGAIYAIGIDGTGLREVTSAALDASGPRWSPDGSKLVFGNPGTAGVSVGRNVSVVNADGTGLRRLTNAAEPDYADAPAWSPDGARIVFAQYIAGTNFISLVVMQSDGSNPIVIWHPTVQTDNFPTTPTWGKAP